jgi:threonine dehydratase
LLDLLTGEGRRPPLVVPSMGNTALGAAVGARDYGFAMVGVVPQTISRAKDEKLEALGVELMKIPTGGGSELLTRATQIAAERGGYFVHPHLDPRWTDGYQASAAEILEALPDCRSLVFPIGGGGLLMGLTAHLAGSSARLWLYGCEAANYPTYTPFNYPRSPTIADGLVLEVPHPEVQARIAQSDIALHLVSDPDIRRAMRDLYQTQALAVEPSSAITTAFIRNHAKELEEPVCVVLTGGNSGAEDIRRLTENEE